MGRKTIPLLLAYLLGALTAVGVFEVRIWQHWQKVASEDTTEAKQQASADVARARAEVPWVMLGSPFAVSLVGGGTATGAVMLRGSAVKVVDGMSIREVDVAQVAAIKRM
jgi:hypothetical protein